MKATTKTIKSKWTKAISVGYTIKDRKIVVEIVGTNDTLIYIVGQQSLDELISMLITISNRVDKMKQPKKAD